MVWGTRVGVILAVAGSAVGLGNFLRFPGQAAAHGGGAFMIPYICALLFLALPIGWAEWAMARHGGRKGFHSGPGIIGVAGRGRVDALFRRPVRADPDRRLYVLCVYRGLVPAVCVGIFERRHSAHGLDRGAGARLEGIFRQRDGNECRRRAEYERGFLALRGLDQHHPGLSRAERRDRKVLPVRAPGDGCAGRDRSRAGAHSGHAESGLSRSECAQRPRLALESRLLEINRFRNLARGGRVRSSSAFRSGSV